MRYAARLSLIAIASLAIGTPALAQGDHGLDLSALPAVGTMAPEDGLAAWESIQAVLPHPRWLNCHVGADTVPLRGTVEAPERIGDMAVWAAAGMPCPEL